MKKIFARGQPQIFFRGDVMPVDKYVYYIEEGFAGLYVSKDKGRKFIFAYKQGEVFPLAPLKRELLSGRAAEFRAMDMVSVLKIGRKEFEAEVYKPENVKIYISKLLDLVHLQVERLDNFEQSLMYQRLVERLNYLSRRLGKKEGKTIVIEPFLSHSDIASSIGTTRETVNRLMQQLKQEGVIDVKKKTLIITSEGALSNAMSDKTTVERSNLGTINANLASLSVGLAGSALLEIVNQTNIT